jgi:hypothetical protein
MLALNTHSLLCVKNDTNVNYILLSHDQYENKKVFTVISPFGSQI